MSKLWIVLIFFITKEKEIKFLEKDILILSGRGIESLYVEIINEKEGRRWS